MLIDTYEKIQFLSLTLFSEYLYPCLGNGSGDGDVYRSVGPLLWLSSHIYELDRVGPV